MMRRIVNCSRIPSISRDNCIQQRNLVSINKTTLTKTNFQKTKTIFQYQDNLIKLPISTRNYIKDADNCGLKFDISRLNFSEKDSSEDNRNAERILRIGKNTDTLINELESYFEKGLTQTDIYDRDIILKEQTHSSIHIKGRSRYTMFSSFLRQCLYAYFSHPVLYINKIRQGSHFNAANSKQPLQNSPKGSIPQWEGPHFPTNNISEDQIPIFDDSDIIIYWTFEGLNRFLSFFFISKVSTFNGISLYQFNDKGDISHHIVLRIYPSPKPRFLSAFRNRWNSMFYPDSPSLVSNKNH
ncbi:hypothetical protein BB560_002009 [Smittium megazygosporum]|uniref:Uncharacterized protein n=1 Tax=Smittium megazygosporum TaxID=133381 RepID=A0A2T9ZFX5_9FUNG|nr:hypothetical protein BB560_002009 [Smittium megazygosporum]